MTCGFRGNRRVGRSLGRLLEEELGVRADLVCIDGVELLELDYVDIGAPVGPAGLLPVLIRSLAFSPGPGPAPKGGRVAAGGAGGRRPRPAERTRKGGPA